MGGGGGGWRVLPAGTIEKLRTVYKTTAKIFSGYDLNNSRFSGFLVWFLRAAHKTTYQNTSVRALPNMEAKVCTAEANGIYVICA